MEFRIVKFKVIEEKINKYNEFSFGNTVNIITGNNGKGKSTLIKMIVYALGFNVQQWANTIEKNNFIYLLNFKVDEKEYELVRKNNIFILNKEIYIGEANYRTKLNEILKLDIKLLGRSTTEIVPYPTDIFLYNYIDQDSSYTKFYKGNHNNTGMYSNYSPKNILEYYLGINRKEITKLEIDIISKEKYREKLENRHIILNRMLEEVEEVEEEIPILSSDIEESIRLYEYQLRENLKEKQKIEYEKTELIKGIVGLDVERKNLESIYDDLSDNTSEVVCQFCNSPHLEGIFSKKYKKELNKTVLLELYGKNKKNLEIQREKLGEKEKEISGFISKIRELENSHFKAREVKAFKDYIESNINLKQKEKLTNQKNDVKERIENSNKIIETLKNQKRSKSASITRNTTKIKNSYRTYVDESSEIFKEIDFTGVKDKFLNFNIKSTGSTNNINHIVVYYTYLKLLNEKSSIQLPILWDSFIKDTFDNTNIGALETFINEKILKLDTQIIISNIPEGKDVEVKKEENYKYINIGDEGICNKDNTDLETDFLDMLFQKLRTS